MLAVGKINNSMLSTRLLCRCRKQTRPNTPSLGTHSGLRFRDIVDHLLSFTFFAFQQHKVVSNFYLRQRLGNPITLASPSLAGSDDYHELVVAAFLFLCVCLEDINQLFCLIMRQQDSIFHFLSYSDKPFSCTQKKKPSCSWLIKSHR